MSSLRAEVARLRAENKRLRALVIDFRDVARAILQHLAAEVFGQHGGFRAGLQFLVNRANEELGA